MSLIWWDSWDIHSQDRLAIIPWNTTQALCSSKQNLPQVYFDYEITAKPTTQSVIKLVDHSKMYTCIPDKVASTSLPKLEDKWDVNGTRTWDTSTG